MKIARFYNCPHIMNITSACGEKKRNDIMNFCKIETTRLNKIIQDSNDAERNDAN